MEQSAGGRRRATAETSELFIDSLVAPLHDGEAGGFRIGDRQGFGEARRADTRDDFADRVLAVEALFQWLAINRPHQLEPLRTNAAGFLRVFGNVFVDRHGPEKGNGPEYISTPARAVKFCESEVLPARLGDARDHAGVGEFAEGNTAELEPADEGMAAARELTAVGTARRAGITGKHGQAGEVAILLEFGAQGGEFLHGLPFALLAFDPAGLGHSYFGGEIWERDS